MSYGTSAVRLDFGKEARIRTGEFFDIPGKRSQHEIVSPTLVSSLSFYFLFILPFYLDTFLEKISLVNWLTKDRHYHHGEVDLVVCFFGSPCPAFSFSSRKKRQTNSCSNLPCWEGYCEDI